MFDLLVTRSHRFDVRLHTSTNDGFHSLTSVAAVIEVTGYTDSDSDAWLSDADVAWFGEWLDRYLAGRDLTAVLDLAPTAENLARYLATAFGSYTAGLASVAVTYPEQGETVRADLVRR